MNKNFYAISQKANSIQAGLLRHHTRDGSITHHVAMKLHSDNLLICALTEFGKAEAGNLVGKKVNLIQKSENDFIYLSGEVEEAPGSNKRALYIRLRKACWFVRKSKGSLSWLQEKHVYEVFPLEPLELAS